MTDFAIVRSATLKAGDPMFRGYVERVASRISYLGPAVVQNVSTLYAIHDATLRSHDGHATLIPVVMAGNDDTATFEVGTDINNATIKVNNRVQIAVPPLPDDVAAPAWRCKSARTTSWLRLRSFHRPRTTRCFSAIT